MAPGANIVLVEATSDSNADLFAAVKTAANLPGVSAVSMSWGLNEYSGETIAWTATSSHRAAIRALLSWRLRAMPGVRGTTPTASRRPRPACSIRPRRPTWWGSEERPSTLNADSTYNSETAWSGSGGGTSLYETEPAYQKGPRTTSSGRFPTWRLMPIRTRVWRFTTRTTTPITAVRGCRSEAPAWRRRPGPA